MSVTLNPQSKIPAVWSRSGIFHSRTTSPNQQWGTDYCKPGIVSSCLSPHCPMLLTKISESHNNSWALMAKRNHFLLCNRDTRSRAWQSKPKEAEAIKIITVLSVLTTCCCHTLPPWGLWHSPDLNTISSSSKSLCCKSDSLLKTPTAACTAGPVGSRCSIGSQQLFCAAHLLFFSPLDCCRFSAAVSYRNRNHSWRGSASSSDCACCRNSPSEPRLDR